MSKNVNLLPMGTKFKVAIKNLKGYSMDGVKNGDVGVVVAYSSGYGEDELVDDEYFTAITRKDGSVSKEFLIEINDMEILK